MLRRREEPNTFDSARGVWARLSKHETAILLLVLLVIIAALAIITKGATVTRSNISNIWLQSSIKGIASIGQLFAILTAGIDLSVGGTALLCSILAARLMTGYAGGMPVGPIAGVLMVGLLIGTINGTLVSRVGMPPLIVTLAVWQIVGVRGASLIVGGGRTIGDLPESIKVFGGGVIAGVPVPVIIFISVAIIGYFVLNYTGYGRNIYAVGGNPVSASLSGINVRKTLMSVYMISGFLSALAGFVLTSRAMSGSLFGVVNLELDTIGAVVIGGVSLMGGRGSLIGAVIGVIIFGVIQNGMNVAALDVAYQDIVKGAIIVGAVSVDYIRRRR